MSAELLEEALQAGHSSYFHILNCLIYWEAQMLRYTNFT